MTVLHRARVILPSLVHEVHHTPRFEEYSCITGGRLNAPRSRTGFFRILERAISRATGAVPHRDDRARTRAAPDGPT